MSSLREYLSDSWRKKLQEPVYKDPHDPHNFGGCWISIHILARNCKTREEKQQAAGAIIKIMLGLGCEICVNHIRKWLDLNPVQHTFDGDEYALFEWTVRAHNYASSNAGNVPMSLAEAKRIWYEEKSCNSKSCHAEQKIYPKNISAFKSYRSY